MTTTLAPTQHRITVGIDAHKDTHWVVVLDEHGMRVRDKQFPTTMAGYQALLGWVAQFGLVDRVGIESTGSYAAGLTRFLSARELTVVEVNTPHPHTRAKKGKDDATDAEAAARKVIAGDATATPKTTTGAIESIRLLRVARESAVKARSAALVQLQDVLITAPGHVRESISGKAGRGKVAQCAKLRPDHTQISDPAQAAKATLRALGRRIEALDHEIDTLDSDLDTLVAATAPTLITRLGIGTGHAGQLLVTAGQNIDRLHSEAAFARLCGAAPIPVSSGKTHRMRLHRGGDRQANRALHMIAVCRLRYDPRTIAYMTKRLSEGLSKKDALRCLKRFIAREVFNDLKNDLAVT